MTKKAIICDFDGTIALQDVTDTIIASVAAKKIWQQIGQMYDTAKIWHKTLNREFVKLLTLSPANLKSLIASRISIRPGFGELVDQCRQKGIALIVVSSGWDFYIRELLSSYNPVFPSSIAELDLGKLSVITNRLHYDNYRHSWSINFPFSRFQCRISSPCKGQVARWLLVSGYDVTAIGNSYSDICMAKLCHKVYSTGNLTKICKSRGIKSSAFTSFSEINLD